MADEMKPQFDPAQIIEGYDLMVRHGIPERTLHLAPEVYLPLCDELQRLRAIEKRAKHCVQPGACIPVSDIAGKSTTTLFVEYILHGE